MLCSGCTKNITGGDYCPWLREMDRPYDLGDNEFHLAFKVDDYEGAHKRHSEMGCICYENPEMGIYFVTDPNNYWLEVVPEKR